MRVNGKRNLLRIIRGMNSSGLARATFALLFASLLVAGAALAQTPVATPDAIAGLPSWAQDKFVAARDPKVFDQYYKSGSKVAQFCSNCHGPSGHSILPDVPNLAGQNTIYVLTQLGKFGDGRRKQFFMEGLMKSLTAEEKVAVAIYYTNQEPKTFPVKNPALAARGKEIFNKNCYQCHGGNGHGNEKYARLAGQGPEYLAANIKRFRDGSDKRSDDQMRQFTRSLTDNYIAAVVAYIGSLN
jgi:cytochrome c553